MTPIEALIVLKTGWSKEDPLSEQLFNKADQVVNNEYARIYLEAKKEHLQRELNEVELQINKSKLTF